MKKVVNDKALIKFANSLVRKVDNINVLKEEYSGQYSPLISLVDNHFKLLHRDKKLLLPELNKNGNESTAIFSDYGGEAYDSAYSTYSFLVCAWNHSYGIKEQMLSIRRKHQLGDKEIAFKDFRYGPIKRALPEYLQCLNHFACGLLFTVIIDKKIQTLFNPDPKDPKLLSKILEENGFGTWKHKVAEKLMRITHTAAYLSALLADKEQKLFWMTDSDAIASGSEQLDKLMKIFERVLPMYTDEPYKLLGGAIPFEEKSVHFLDLLSSTDIAAGSIEHYFTRKAKMEDSLTIKKEANLVLEWLGNDGVGLKKTTILIEQGEQPNSFKSSEVKFESLGKDEMQIIPIYI